MDDVQFHEMTRASEERSKTMINTLIGGFKDLVLTFEKAMVSAKMDCVIGTKNTGRIIALEKDMGDTRVDLKDIKDRLLGRPSRS